MNTIGRIGAVITVAFVALSLAACSGSKKDQKPEQTTSFGQQVSEAGQATGEAAKTAGQETQHQARRASQATSRQAERVEKGTEMAVGGGPVKSDTLEALDKVDREIAHWKPAVDKYGDKVKEQTKLRFQQLEQQSKDLREMYDKMQQKTNLGVAELDETYQGQAKKLKDAWKRVQTELRSQLGANPKVDTNKEE